MYVYDNCFCREKVKNKTIAGRNGSCDVRCQIRSRNTMGLGISAMNFDIFPKTFLHFQLVQKMDEPNEYKVSKNTQEKSPKNCSKIVQNQPKYCTKNCSKIATAINPKNLPKIFQRTLKTHCVLTVIMRSSLFLSSFWH